MDVYFVLVKTKCGVLESATFWAGYIFGPRNNFNESWEKHMKDQIIKIYSSHIFVISLVELFFTTIAVKLSRNLDF